MTDLDLEDWTRATSTAAPLGVLVRGRVAVYRGDSTITVAVMKHQGRDYVRVELVNPKGEKSWTATLRCEELDQVVEALRDARNVTLGNPKNEPKQSALDEIEMLKAKA